MPIAHYWCIRGETQPQEIGDIVINVIIWRVIFEFLNLIRSFYNSRSTILYFAYGANLDPQVLAQRRIQVFSSREFILQDFELNFSHQGPYEGLGYASIEHASGRCTYGKLYSISKLDALRLDFYEGARFIRRYSRVLCRQEEFTFFFYQTVSPRLNLKPSRDYLDKILRGFSFLEGVPRSYIERLETSPTQETFVVSASVNFCVSISDKTHPYVAKILSAYDRFVVATFVKYIRDSSITVKLIRNFPNSEKALIPPTFVDRIKQKHELLSLVTDRRRQDILTESALASRFALELKPYSNFREVQAFREDLLKSLGGDPLDFSKTRIVNTSGESGVLLAYLSAPYNRDLALECLLYEDVKVPDEIAYSFPSVARPVKVIAHTAGFNSDLAVAVFPENFLATGSVSNDIRSLYFINKFVERWKNKTLPFVAQKTTSSSLRKLKSAGAGDIEVAAALWVHLHEHFHRNGLLPLPQFLKLKSSKSTAGLEELRVDLLSILACNSPVVQKYCDAELLEQFILAERLFRYGMERSPNDDYDSRGAHIFYCYLRKSGVISSEETLQLNVNIENYRFAALELSNLIARLEQEIASESFIVAKKRLTKFVKDLADYDVVLGLFPQEKFYVG